MFNNSGGPNGQKCQFKFCFSICVLFVGPNFEIIDFVIPVGRFNQRLGLLLITVFWLDLTTPKRRRLLQKGKLQGGDDKLATSLP